MKNIVMVGMPGCGKSTVGVVLAKTLGKSFVDTDLLICARENNTLQNIIEEKGLRAFEKIESQTGRDLNVKNTVVATGGSMILYEDAISHLKENSVMVYIDVSLKELERRLTNIKTRGITFEKGESLEDIYSHRTPLYKKYADITVCADKLTVEETVTAIAEKLK